MNEAQRRSYFIAWGEVCKVRGWLKLSSADREAKRKEITRKATGVESTKALTQVQITALFALLKFLLDPTNLDAASAVANPELAQQRDACRRHIFVIRKLAREGGFNEVYIAKIAEYDMRVAQVSRWDRLPVEALKRVLIHLSQRKNDKDPNVRQTGPRRPKPAPVREPAVAPRPQGDKPFEYTMRPRTTYQPKAAASRRDENPF